ncbi:ribosome small subunit-dependent GTPase A [Hazenella sp. IB182353]|uniref:ribosome small subunit-dependent GTPase A n=1 Tax=Polycladospora coralii TaxID=2771432 RepID=UPI001745CBAE|nr:ribosome small subunit-dependent GTPase A [Polycladospora coralii]MBS7530351.1 ribosome small subunit-dependent GTPase A [Polycladospora coralii]
MPIGQIVKAISGFYYVCNEERNQIQCRARGVFKFEKKKLTPLVGDWVAYEETGLDEGVITSVQPRSSELKRPPIANVEQAIVVCALREPQFQQMPVDRFLVHGERVGLSMVICLTKRDLVEDEEELKSIWKIYEGAGYPILTTSVKNEDGLRELEEFLLGKTSVFAGQSGVGKSSLLNRILPDRELETGKVSDKLGRGRHTTRQVELITLQHGGQVADTPGFSQLTFQEFEPTELGDYFPEMRERAGNCRFRGCIHENEPNCAIKEAVEAGDIHLERYRNYLHFLGEIKELQQRRY